VIGGGRAYFVYRYRIGGKEREASLGPFPELSLAEAREKHADLRKRVKVDKADPIAQKRAAKTVQPSAAPTFGAMADLYIETHQGTWRNDKHRYQWRQTLTDYCGPIRDKPVDGIGTADVLAVLMPLWSRAPETASRLRGRIQTVIETAQALGISRRTKPTQRAGRAIWTTCWRRRRSSACADTTRRCLTIICRSL
jgi:integrase-like protein/Arm domain-containing DNA-binding protein